MRPILEEIFTRCNAGERVALCTVVSTRGSTPQAKSAKMLVVADGKTIGTLGGGCVEAEVRKQALALLSADESKLLEFNLNSDYGWDDGLICGGIMDVFIQVLDHARAGDLYRLRDALLAEQSAQFSFKFPRGDSCGHYVEDLGPPPMLLIAGAGHVGQALAQIAAKIDFRVTVVDDRSDYASPERFPDAIRIIGNIESELRRFPIDASTYVVIVTRGHRNDGQALAAIIHSPAAYIGLIGSKTKIKLIMSDLHAAGVATEKLLGVHAPIGLDIGAITVPEIAISIAAELVAARRGQLNQPARPLKMDPSELGSWLSRKSQDEPVAPPAI
jgi:xanthine dehydrogenase accessory factor